MPLINIELYNAAIAAYEKGDTQIFKNALDSFKAAEKQRMDEQSGFENPFVTSFGKQPPTVEKIAEGAMQELVTAFNEEGKQEVSQFIQKCVSADRKTPDPTPRS